MKNILLLTTFFALFTHQTFAAQVCKAQIEAVSPCGTGRIEFITSGGVLFSTLPESYIVVNGDSLCYLSETEFNGELEHFDYPNSMTLKHKGKRVGTFDGKVLKLEASTELGVIAGEYELTCKDI